jgi:hypothetical protein
VRDILVKNKLQKRGARERKNSQKERERKYERKR